MNYVLLILLGISLTSSAFEAIVTDVTDGDTVKIEYQNKTIKVRLAGIDTPELKQKFGLGLNIMSQRKLAPMGAPR